MAQTNVQAFSGDVAISSNLAVDTNTLFVDSVGNKVGIGTDVPSSKLTVNQIPEHRSGYDHSLAPMTVTNRTVTSSTTLNDPKDVLNLAREGTQSEAYGARATFKLSRYENGGTNSRTRLDLNLAHGSYDDQNIMTMRSDGNVGIGKTNPGTALDVVGDVAISSNLAVDTNTLFVDSVGNKVGIGTTNPETTLQLHKEFGDDTLKSAAEIKFSTNNPGNTTWDVGSIRGAVNLNAGGSSNYPGGLVFATKSPGGTGVDLTDKMVIDANGNVGIGTNSPFRALDVSVTGSIAFGSDVTQVTERGLYWSSSDSDYAIYKTGGSWSSPDYQQLLLKWSTGIVLQTARGTYGRSFVGVDDRMSIGSSYYTTKSPTDGLIVQGNVGIGTDSPDGTLHVKADNRVHITAGTVPVFTGLQAPSEGRAQLVLNSSYSDLVIASSFVNDNHGSTLSFATVNPSNTAEYRKFVINQGNWGSRKDFLDFGLSASTSDPNPHSSINGADTVLTLDGNNKRVGIGTNAPGSALDVVGTVTATTFSGALVGNATTATTAAGITYTEVSIIDPDVTSGTWTQNASNSEWGPPKFNTAYNSRAYADFNVPAGTAVYRQWNIPTGMKSAYISQLQWSNCGYVDIHGVQSDNGLVFLRRVNTLQAVENSNEGNPGQHDGSTISFIGSGLDSFTAIRITLKSGRLYLTGLAFTTTLDGTEGTGMVNPAQITGTVSSATYATSAGSATSAGTATTATNQSGGTVSATTITSSGIITCNANKIVITGAEPTLYLRDNNARTGMIHQNDNRMYFLSGVANSDSWTITANSRWPLYIDTSTNQAVFGGDIDAAAGTVSAAAFSGGSVSATTGFFSSTLEADGRIYADNGCHVRGDWLRVDGNQGIYFESWGGGWFMQDSTYIRAYQNKTIYTLGNVLAGGFIAGDTVQANGSFGRSANYKYFNQTQNLTTAFLNAAVGIYAVYDCFVRQIMVPSDSRIKKDIIDLNDTEALEILRKLEPKKYKYVDPSRGDSFVYGFIAQEVANVFPIATAITTSYIPNVLKEGVILNDIFTFEDYDTSQLLTSNVTDNVKMMINLIDAPELGEIEVIAKMTEIIDSKKVKLEIDYTNTSESVQSYMGNPVSAIMYGQEVTDFIALKKENIWTISTSALQEIDRNLNTEKLKIINLQNEVIDLMTRVSILESN